MGPNNGASDNTAEKAGFEPFTSFRPSPFAFPTEVLLADSSSLTSRLGVIALLIVLPLKLWVCC